MKKLFVTLSVMLFSIVASASEVGVYCFMASEGSETNGDENLRVKLVINGKGTMLLEVENLTDRIIFIDRGRSFAWTNEASMPLFAMRSTTDSHTYGERVICGWSNDVKWEESESYTHSRTMYDQRIQAVAPHGTTLVYSWEGLSHLLDDSMIAIGKPSGWFTSHCKGKFLDTGKKFRQGDKRFYDRLNTPLTLAADIEYSFKEIGEPVGRISVSDYVSEIKVDSRYGVTRDGELLNHTKAFKRCFGFRSGKTTGAIVGETLTTAALVGLVVLAITADPQPDSDFDSNW